MLAHLAVGSLVLNAIILLGQVDRLALRLVNGLLVRRTLAEVRRQIRRCRPQRDGFSTAAVTTATTAASSTSSKFTRLSLRGFVREELAGFVGKKAGSSMEW